jgi:hypothetical protein
VLFRHKSPEPRSRKTKTHNIFEANARPQNNSGSSRIELGTTATASVITVDQLMKAIPERWESQECHPKQHIAYAAVDAALTVGLLELLRRDELRMRESNHLTGTATVDAEHSPHH